MQLSSTRPYLIRALYQWMIDNGLTPHLLVNAEADGVQVPAGCISEGGRVVLNIGSQAVQDLALDDEYILFSARFNRVSHDVTVPVHAVEAIYAKEESSKGMAFASDQTATDLPPEPSTPPSGKPNLKLIK